MEHLVDKKVNAQHPDFAGDKSLKPAGKPPTANSADMFIHTDTNAKPNTKETVALLKSADTAEIDNHLNDILTALKSTDQDTDLTKHISKIQEAAENARSSVSDGVWNNVKKWISPSHLALHNRVNDTFNKIAGAVDSYPALKASRDKIAQLTADSIRQQASLEAAQKEAQQNIKTLTDTNKWHEANSVQLNKDLQDAKSVVRSQLATGVGNAENLLNVLGKNLPAKLFNEVLSELDKKKKDKK